MITTPHAVTGAAIGAITGQWWLTVPLAILSHYTLDTIPHWQETLPPYTPTRRTWTRIPIDLALAGTLVTLLTLWWPERAGTIWLGAIMGNLPDADVLLILKPQWKRGWLAREYAWHCRIQRETASWWGLVPQVAMVMSALGTSWWSRS